MVAESYLSTTNHKCVIVTRDVQLQSAPALCVISLMQQGLGQYYVVCALSNTTCIPSQPSCCCRGASKRDMRVVVGQHSLDTRDTLEMAWEIDRVWLHPDYQ